MRSRRRRARRPAPRVPGRVVLSRSLGGRSNLKKNRERSPGRPERTHSVPDNAGTKRELHYLSTPIIWYQKEEPSHAGQAVSQSYPRPQRKRAPLLLRPAERSMEGGWGRVIPIPACIRMNPPLGPAPTKNIRSILGGGDAGILVAGRTANVFSARSGCWQAALQQSNPEAVGAHCDPAIRQQYILTLVKSLACSGQWRARECHWVF